MQIPEKLLRFLKKMPRYLGLVCIFEWIKRQWSWIRNKSAKVWTAIKQWTFSALLQIHWRSDKILRFLKYFLLCFIWLSFILLTNYFDLFNFENLLPDRVSNFELGAAAITGAILSIIFAISSFTLQKAADLYSAKFYHMSALGDPRERFVFFWLSISTLFFCKLGLDPNFHYRWTYVSFLVLLTCFLMIPWHYKNVVARTDPLYALDQLYKKLGFYLKNIRAESRFLSRISKLLTRSIGDGYFSKKSYDLNHRNIQDLIDGILETTIRLSNRDEKHSTKVGLNYLCKSFKDIFDLRADSLLVSADLTYGFSFSTDLDNFLSKNLERLESLGQKFLKEGRAESVRDVLNVFVFLGLHLPKIQKTEILQENSLFGLVVGHMNNLATFFAESKDLESNFAVAKSFTSLGQTAVSKKYLTNLLTLEEYMFKFALKNMTEERFVVVEEVLKGYIKIIQSKVVSPESQLLQIKGTFRQIIEIYKAITLFRKAGALAGGSNVGLSRPLDLLKELVEGVELAVVQQTSAIPDKGYDHIFEFLNELDEFIRQLSREVDPSLLVRDLSLEISFLLLEVHNLLKSLRQVCPERKVDIDSLSVKLLMLPSWIIGSIGNGFDEFRLDHLIDTIFVGALYSIQENVPKITKVAVKILTQISEKMTGDIMDFRKAVNCMILLFKIGSVCSEKTSFTELAGNIADILIKFEVDTPKEIREDFPSDCLGYEIDKYIGEFPNQAPDLYEHFFKKQMTKEILRKYFKSIFS